MTADSCAIHSPHSRLTSSCSSDWLCPHIHNITCLSIQLSIYFPSIPSALHNHQLTFLSCYLPPILSAFRMLPPVLPILRPVAAHLSIYKTRWVSSGSCVWGRTVRTQWDGTGTGNKSRRNDWWGACWADIADSSMIPKYGSMFQRNNHVRDVLRDSRNTTQTSNTNDSHAYCLTLE
jgi:hypothetical protein